MDNQSRNDVGFCRCFKHFCTPFCIFMSGVLTWQTACVIKDTPWARARTHMARGTTCGDFIDVCLGQKKPFLFCYAVQHIRARVELVIVVDVIPAHANYCPVWHILNPRACWQRLEPVWQDTLARKPRFFLKVLLINFSLFSWANKVKIKLGLMHYLPAPKSWSLPAPRWIAGVKEIGKRSQPFNELIESLWP